MVVVPRLCYRRGMDLASRWVMLCGWGPRTFRDHTEFIKQGLGKCWTPARIPPFHHVLNNTCMHEVKELNSWPINQGSCPPPNYWAHQKKQEVYPPPI